MNTMKSIKDRLIIAVDPPNVEDNEFFGINGNCFDLKFFNSSVNLVATGYNRVVIGKRGPYVEFKKSQINFDFFYIPEDQTYRLSNKVVYYEEWRTLDKAFTKLYIQKRTVKYADYKIGMCYISPSDLYLEDGEKVIT